MLREEDEEPRERKKERERGVEEVTPLCGVDGEGSLATNQGPRHQPEIILPCDITE